MRTLDDTVSSGIDEGLFGNSVIAPEDKYNTISLL